MLSPSLVVAFTSPCQPVFLCFVTKFSNAIFSLSIVDITFQNIAVSLNLENLKRLENLLPMWIIWPLDKIRANSKVSSIA